MTNLQTNYLKICNHLGLQCTCPFSIEVDGTVITAPCMISELGGPKGMIIVTDYNVLKCKGNQLAAIGYGWSVLDEHEQVYALDELIEMVEMFCEWSWGSSDVPPDWYYDYEEKLGWEG